MDGRLACSSLLLLWVVILSACMPVEALNSTAGPVRINCGGSRYVDAFNRTWEADRGFLGGQPVDYSLRGLALGLPDGRLYDTAREWANTPLGEYSLDLPPNVPGSYYWVRLHFAELVSGNTTRAFAILANGFLMTSHLSVPKAGTPFLFEFSLRIPRGPLVLALTRISGAMHVAAIEVALQYKGQYRNRVATAVALRTVARYNLGGTVPFVDATGRMWTPDERQLYLNSDQTAASVTTRVRGVLNVEEGTGVNAAPDLLPPQIYESARKVARENLTADGLQLFVPTVEPTYHLLRLHFAEVEGAPRGERMMDIYVNSEVGGPVSPCTTPPRTWALGPATLHIQQARTTRHSITCLQSSSWTCAETDTLQYVFDCATGCSQMKQTGTISCSVPLAARANSLHPL
eukprot:jgi/Mesen1/8556/ME000489S07944